MTSRRALFWFLIATGALLLVSGVIGSDPGTIAGGLLPIVGGAIGLTFMDRTAVRKPPRLHRAIGRGLGVMALGTMILLIAVGANQTTTLVAIGVMAALLAGYFAWIAHYTGRI
jgi:hypothetical protein